MQLQQLLQQQSAANGNSFVGFVSSQATANAMKSGGGGGAAGGIGAGVGERSVFDEFNIPAVLTGDGRQETKFFVDSNHSLVSLITRIVPSPDWFIGVDSFQVSGLSYKEGISVVETNEEEEGKSMEEEERFHFGK